MYIDFLALALGITFQSFAQGQFTKDAAGFQQYSVQLAAATARVRLPRDPTVAARTDHISQIPENLSYDAVATLPCALTCAYVGLYNKSPHGLGFRPPVAADTRGIYGGTPLVVLGGSTSVGQLGKLPVHILLQVYESTDSRLPVIQLAKLSGFSPIITTASLTHAPFLRSIGATRVLDRSLTHNTLVASITASAKDLTPTPIKSVYDCVSLSSTQQVGWDVLAPGGTLSLVLPEASDLKRGEGESAGKSVITVLGILTLPHNKPLLCEFYHDVVSELLDKDLIKVST